MFHHRSERDGKDNKPKRNKSKGRVETRTSIKKVNATAASKLDRQNTLRQIRDEKKNDLLHRRRLGAGVNDGSTPPPKVVLVVAFHTQADAVSLKRRVLATCGSAAEVVAALPPHVPATAVLPAFAQGGPGCGKPRVLLVDPPRDVLAVMDAAKCADIVLCVFGPHASLDEPAFDATGYRLLTALRAQGMPTVIGAVHGGPDSATMLSGKKAAESKKFVTRYFSSELGTDAKLYQAGTDEEMKSLVRALGSTTAKEISWRNDRGYLLGQTAEYSSAEGMLCLTGYVRGPGLRCKHLAHLTGHGDFTIARITALPDPCPVTVSRGGMATDGGAAKVVDELQPGEELDMQRLQPYDPTTAEQTWPTDEEMGATAGSRPKRQGAAKIAVPDAADVPLPGEGDEEMNGSEDGDDSESEKAPSVAASGLGGTDDGWDVSSNMTMEVPSASVVAAERAKRDVMLERSKEDMEFPDEVDFPLDVPARERFQKYRGLKSFRTSEWDPYEELPVEYSRIWEFEGLQSTARAFRQQYSDDCYDLEGDGVSTLFCAVYIRGVPPIVMDSQPRGVPFVLSGLFQCEQKVSVVHGHISRMGDYTEAIKSKQELSLHCGFRRFSAKPTFSELPKKGSTSKKYKFQRFLHPETTACASFYAPVVFPPCRLMAFVQTENGPELVASGAITGADPKQLIIKRAILTGYPFRTHKTKGIVRFMFFNPSDVRWFKPVELVTKKGLRGHISESLGLHGYMKCRFSTPIKQDDTVCMHLYKRVYPKWHPPAWGGRAEDGPAEA